MKKTAWKGARRVPGPFFLAAHALFLSAWLPGVQPRAAAQEALLETEISVYDAVAGQDEAAAFRFAWLSGKPMAWRLAPMAGAMATNEGSLYSYGGIYADLQLPGKLFLMPSFAAGLYSAGNGPDLGHTVEFRSGTILGIRFSGGTRVGMSFHHMSNADFGRRNPGAETLGLTITVPLGR